MKRSVRWVALGLFLLVPMFFGCGGGANTPLIQPQPATVRVSPSGVSMSASATQQFTATVYHTDNTAVNWTLDDCSAAACGTISSSGLYTAPSLIVNPAGVTVIATLQADSKTSGHATVYQAPLSLEVSPAQTLSMGARGAQVFTASITRHPNPDVSWSISGTSCAGEGCGTLTSITGNSATYNAPATVPNQAVVMVKATAMADDTKSQSVSINLRPISVSLNSGSQAIAAPSGTRNFRAIVQYDPENAGVNWSLAGAGCSGDGCGTLGDATSTSVVYHAPASAPDPPTVTLAASSVTDSAQIAVSTITVSSAQSALQGKYAFLTRGYRRESGTVTMETMAGHFDADGNGNLVGVWDANRGPVVDQAQSITGSYAVQPDGRGNMTIEAGSLLLTFNLVMDATGAAARLSEDTRAADTQTQVLDSNLSPDSRGSSGLMVRQDPASFSLSSVNGDRVIALSGEHTHSPVAALGRFTSSTGGALSAGVADLTWQEGYSGFTQKTELSGSFSVPDPGTGRGMASLTTNEGSFNFAYYIVSNRRSLLVQTDARGSRMPTLSGEVRLQTGAGSFANSSLNAPVIFNLAGTIGMDDIWFGDPYPDIAIGEILPNGSGWFAVTYDQNEAGLIATSNGTGSGDYAVEPNGRVSLTIVRDAVAYLTDQNSGYLIRQSLQGADFGSFEPQSDGPFDLQALSGTFLFNTGLPSTVESLNSSGLLTVGEDGKVVATLSGAISDFSGTLNVDSSGRGVLTLETSSATTSGHAVIWAVSPEHCIALITADEGYFRPVLVHLDRSQ